MLLNEPELTTALATLPGWQRVDNALIRHYRLRNFAEALTLLNQIAQLAEQHNHHPDLHLHGYRNLQVQLSTHSAGGITTADIQLAQAIAALA